MKLNNGYNTVAVRESRLIDQLFPGKSSPWLTPVTAPEVSGKNNGFSIDLKERIITKYFQQVTKVGQLLKTSVTY